MPVVRLNRKSATGSPNPRNRKLFRDAAIVSKLATHVQHEGEAKSECFN